VPELLEAPPYSHVQLVTDIMHGVAITDPYRWLEDQDSPRTRQWLQDQTAYARAYLDGLPARDRIRDRIRQLVDIETYDSVLLVHGRYYFRKRLPGQEQPCICMREEADRPDDVLIDPSAFGTGKYTSVKPVLVSPNGRLLLYEIKESGERTGRFELLDIETKMALPDKLERGYLRGFAFAPDSRSYYYSHEPLETLRPLDRVVYHHALGTLPETDSEVFFAGQSQHIRVGLQANDSNLLICVMHFGEIKLRDYYIKRFALDGEFTPLLTGVDCVLAPKLVGDRILALTDRDAPNRRIVEVRFHATSGTHDLVEMVPTRDATIRQWIVLRKHMLVSYIRGTSFTICVFDLTGKQLGEIPTDRNTTVRLIAGDASGDEVLVESESFFEPASVSRYSLGREHHAAWVKKTVPYDPDNYIHSQVAYTSKDGIKVPMSLVGKRDTLTKRQNPAILTSYGGFGSAMTPQFSVFVAFLMEHGCVFALPNIRGGSEFGAKWHEAAKRRKRQTAIDDFLSAAQWLSDNGVADRNRIAIFGGSNSGLLVGAALTQAPAMFRAAVCIAPLLDMLRYHFFNNAFKWKDEFGTAEDPEDFRALAGYSPYYRIEDKTSYPAVMLVSGDADQNCNPLHARKMAARLQAANVSSHPIILDYNEFRGHSPVLPLSTRVDALTDRMAFLCDQLGLAV
jgi:prolyl oligopeptidase